MVHKKSPILLGYCVPRSQNWLWTKKGNRYLRENLNELRLLFEYWCRKQQLTAQTRDLIAAIRSAPPSRRVQGRSKNVRGFYPSRKMGQTIQFESHTVELWAIYIMEHAADVLEFYDQPSPFKIQYQNQNGRKICHYHTPDFFVLRTTGAAWEEWKPETELKRLAQKYPSRYQKTEDGHWHCPPSSAYAESVGLKYYIRTDAELHPIFTQNKHVFGRLL